MSKAWPKISLGDVLTERREVPDPGALATSAVRIVSKIGFNDGRIQLRADGETKTGMILIRPGDLVLSGINAAKGAIAIYGEENTEPIAATIHYGSYIPNKDRVDIRYLWWLLRSNTFRELLQEYVPGGIKTELKAKRLLPIPVPLPPLPEQRRIVARIEQLAAKIEEARRLRQQAAEQADALVVNRAGQVLSQLAERFPRREFGSFSPHVTSGPRNWAKHYEENGYRFYRAQDIGPEGQVLQEAKVFISPPPGEQGRSAMLETGDLMLVITGATVGRVTIFREGVEPGFVSQHVAICRLPATQIDPGMLFGVFEALMDNRSCLVSVMDRASRASISQTPGR